jgi:hypothetical protein
MENAALNFPASASHICVEAINPSVDADSLEARDEQVARFPGADASRICAIGIEDHHDAVISEDCLP